MIGTKIKNTPEIRFKEFSVPWLPQRLGDYLIPKIQRISAKTSLSIYSSTREGLKPQKEYYDNREVANEGEYGIVPEGFFVYRHMSDDLTFKFNINYVGEPIAVSKEYPVFKTINLDSDFLILKLNHGSDFKRFAITQKKGGTRTRLYFKDLCSWTTLLPDLHEQQKIAAFLSAVDDKLTNLSRKRELLENYKRGLMKQLFSQQIRFKQDDGSDFPEWEKHLLGDIVTVNPTNGDLPFKFLYIDLESVKKGTLTDPKIILKDNAPSRAQRILRKGDILFQTVRPYQQNNFLFNLDGDYVASTGYAQLRANSAGDFVYHLVHTKNFLAEVMNRCTGTSYPAINSNDLKLIEILIPKSRSEQQKIANFLQSIDNKINAVAKQITELDTFKKGLLQKLFV